MSPTNLAIPLEVITIICSYADIRTLFALSRTSRTLHTLLNPSLEKTFTAELPWIAAIAVLNHRPITFARVRAAALDARDRLFPGTRDPRTRKDIIYGHDFGDHPLFGVDRIAGI
ncbi:hypothetical protein P167DRAFT_540599, partial [Morchella conica CCBAS932]